jgi:hypothetical protein
MFSYHIILNKFLKEKRNRKRKKKAVNKAGVEWRQGFFKKNTTG